MRALPLLLLVVACGASEAEKRDKEKECEKIASDIRNAASLRGISPVGICNSPAAGADFRDACNSLQRCNQELDEM